MEGVEVTEDLTNGIGYTLNISVSVIHDTTTLSSVMGSQFVYVRQWPQEQKSPFFVG